MTAFKDKIKITLGTITKEIEVVHSWVEGQEGTFEQERLPSYVDIVNDEEIIILISKMIEDKYKE